MMDSRTVWTVLFANASRARRNSPKSEQFLRTRERNHKTTVHYCPTVQRKCFRKVMSFTTQSNHYFSSNSSLLRIELIITSHHRRHLFLNTIALQRHTLKERTPHSDHRLENLTNNTLRGMLVKNLKGTPLAKSVMPLIPMDIIRQNTARLTDNTSQK